MLVVKVLERTVCTLDSSFPFSFVRLVPRVILSWSRAQGWLPEQVVWLPLWLLVLHSIDLSLFRWGRSRVSFRILTCFFFALALAVSTARQIVLSMLNDERAKVTSANVNSSPISLGEMQQWAAGHQSQLASTSTHPILNPSYRLPIVGNVFGGLVRRFVKPSSSAPGAGLTKQKASIKIR